MDPTLEIKARLPIEELVGQYCQLKKKGRGFVCLCPFHQDTHPSMQVSPDKGIAYCFACSSGGDIFSFYQKIEGVDFRQALKDLGEKTGVKVEGLATETPAKKDHKDRIRECLLAAEKFYAKMLNASTSAKAYLSKRAVSEELQKEFSLGLAPDSFSDTYEHLLKAGFSRKEIVDASLGIQKDLSEGKIYDRFRNRIMFPISDGNGQIIGFGGRTLGDDDAKYINSGETPLYNKSVALYGLHLAKDAIRESKKVILVEGYFDVLACHRIGIRNTVAVSGTALTEQHVKILKRHAETVVLCLDQDRAGQQAAERAFLLCAEAELPVHAVTLEEKDPDDAAMSDPEGLKTILESGGTPYLDLVIEKLQEGDLSSTEGKRDALMALLPLLQALASSVERDHYTAKVASLLQTTEMALKEDLEKLKNQTTLLRPLPDTAKQEKEEASGFSSTEIALGIFLLFPTLKTLLSELIEPQEEFCKVLYEALKDIPDVKELTLDMLTVSEEWKERAAILMLYCEEHGFSQWSQSLAEREIRKNCAVSNREILREKQREIARKLQIARKEGNASEETKLSLQYQKVLKLAQIAKT